MRDVVGNLEQMEHAEVPSLITEGASWRNPSLRVVTPPRVHGLVFFTVGKLKPFQSWLWAPRGETQIIDGLDPEETFYAPL